MIWKYDKEEMDASNGMLEDAGGYDLDTPFSLKDTLLGCASSAMQTEGFPTKNSWYDWADKPGRIRDGTSPRNGNRHWEHWKEDAQLAHDLKLETVRMSLEWSRIEPAPGCFCHQAIEHYRAEIQELQRHGIKVLITLHHFTNPSWFEKRGAFTRKDSVPIFLRYVTYVVEQIGDLVSDYVTINEPNVYDTLSYFVGQWPPQKVSPRAAIRVMRNLTLCHLAAYRRIHQIRKKNHFSGRTMVGFAEHMRIFSPATPGDRPIANALEYLFQGLTESFYTGRFRHPIGADAPMGEGRFYDFIGINYYTRCWVHGFHVGTKPNCPTNDLGWEIYPEGLSILMRHRYKRFCAPIWITENGVCDATDRLRPRFLYDHLKQVAMSGLPVERYYHWTMLDNFELAEGESARFGLVECDFQTQQRRPRKSAYFYKEIIEHHGVTQDMIDRYLTPKQPAAACPG